MLSIQTILIFSLFLTGLSSPGELVTKGTVMEIRIASSYGPEQNVKESAVNIGGSWFSIAPEIKDINQIFEGFSADIAQIQTPFYAEITFQCPENSDLFYVKKIKYLSQAPKSEQVEQ